MYTFVLVIFMRLENVPGFEFFRGALRSWEQLFHSSPLSRLVFPLLSGGFGGENWRGNLSGQITVLKMRLAEGDSAGLKICLTHCSRSTINWK